MRKTVLSLAAVLFATAAPTAGAQGLQTHTSSYGVASPTSPRTETRTLTCAAVAPGAIGAEIVDCFLRGVHTNRTWSAGDRDALPGPSSASATVLTFVLSEPFELCTRARATFADGAVQETPLRCTLAPAAIGSGA